MTIEFTLEEAIDAPKDTVFEAMTDLDAAREWMPNLVKLEELTDGEFGVGTEWRETRDMFGKEASEVIEVRAMDRPDSIRMVADGTRGDSGRGLYDFHYRFDDLGDGRTKVTLDAEISELGTIVGFLAKFFTGPFKSAVEKDLAAMKDYLERDPAAASDEVATPA